MSGKDDNRSDNFGSYKDEKSISEAQDIEKDYRDLVGKSLVTGNHARAKHTLQDGLLRSESSSSLRKVRFSEQELSAGTLVSNIKYDYPGSQNDSLFYLFYNQLDYALVDYFAEFETLKGNVDKLLYNPLIAPFIKKLFYQNANK